MKRGSLTSKILGLMMVLILLSSGLSIFALANLSYSLGDARAINASGSLRMQSYRLMFYANSGSEEAEDKIREFEATLYSPALKNSLNWSTPQRLKDQYLLVIDKWKVMKYFIEEENSRLYASSLKDFVDTIDLFVLETEHHAAFKLKLLAASQLLGLGMMLAIALVAVRYTKRKVVEPLNQLMLSANTISKGNFDVDMPQTEYIELQALADALDSTAKELSALYGDLESQVQEKTLALTRANQELNFLYDNLVMLHGKTLDYRALKAALDQLKQYEQLDYLRLIIQDEGDIEEAIEAEGGWPAEIEASCRFPLTFEHTDLGYLEMVSDKAPNRPLFENFAIMLARSILIHQSAEQRQQLALMEERGVIARELHDSLGQVLSFLKIQITLLRKGLDDSCRNPEVEQQLNEINEGVSTAYVQLRELLSTFRLTIKEPNLKHALEAMLEQLRSQTHTKLTLDYGIREQLLGANQHIHILQLTREATLNAIKHANASEIVIQCAKNNEGMINISVSDDGVGIEHLKERDQHFGIGIMHERASKLEGQLRFSSNEAGGTTVTLTLPPHQESSQHG
ncbi:nitrate/nitrite two-component system sensor histidine kinase NarQ [Shewanella amazonensis]|uniref:Sensor protein n=1 Tax=Shewanella amazonensis (strain ATCC BAA-1098 / SB2B) TaxID=326297 RepID=A1S399_SHEAM|nr:nitrate/nitrite two-component system sensor histidine kinase NarQ [Shewanella amazonensis]ABL98855.1 signal transduction histidine kinase, nitrate/nitrite-specific, NarQ [Shewanella amazonensis SB2B]